MRQLRQPRVRINRDAHIDEQQLGGPAQFGVRLVATGGVPEQCLSHAQVAVQPEPLLDDPDAGLARLLRGRGDQRLPTQRQLARVGLDPAGDDAGQSRLAHPVLADEPQHLAAIHGEIDPRRICRSPNERVIPSTRSSSTISAPRDFESGAISVLHDDSPPYCRAWSARR